MELEIISRFLTKVDHQDNPPCWEWKAGTTNGYGRFSIGDKDIYSHRFAYELFRGDIPNGFILDHLCRNRACVNPYHLEVVTQRINILRGFGITAINSKKTHCKNGHELKGDNIRKYPLKFGQRQCKTCHNEYMKENR